MSSSKMNDQEKSVLRWGGMSGIVGGILFTLSMAFVAIAIGDDPADLQEIVARFPEIHMLRVIENSVYLVALLFEIPLYLSLFWALRKQNLAPTLFGSVISIVGLVSMIISSTPHVAHHPLSEIFQEVGTTPEAQEVIAIIWQGTWGMFDAPLYVGFFVVPIGIILIGIAMFGTSNFGKGLAWMSVVVGFVALVAAIFQMIDPASDVGALSYLLPIIFYFVVGMKLSRLSKAA